MHRIVALLIMCAAGQALAVPAAANDVSEHGSDTEPHLPPPPSLPTKYVAVALLPIQTFEVPESITRPVEQALLDEIDETPGFRAISPADAAEDLNALGLHPEACERDVTCLAQAGRYARGHTVLDVWITALGGAVNISMRLLDTNNATEIRRNVEELPEDAQARLLVLHRMIVQLLTPDAYLGQLLVNSKEPGSEIYIDDTLVGLTPMKEPIAFKAGVHILRISKEGYTDVNQFVDIALNRTTTLDVAMKDTTVNFHVDLIAAKDDGALFLLSEESGYEVRIDGEPAGVTPLQGAMLHLAPGAHQVTMRKPGRPVIQQTVNIQPQQRADFALVKKDDGTMALESQGSGPPSRPLPTLESIATQKPVTPTKGEVPRAQRSWRTPTGIAVGSVGLAGIVVGAIYEHDVQLYSDEAKRISQSMQDGNSVTTVAQAIALSNRLDVLNERGPKVTAAARAGLIGGSGLVAVGAALMIWDWIRISDNGTTDGVAIRLSPDGPGDFGLRFDARF